MTNQEKPQKKFPQGSESDRQKMTDLLSGWHSLSTRAARIDLLEAELTALGEEITTAGEPTPEERIRLGMLSSYVRALTGE